MFVASRRTISVSRGKAFRASPSTACACAGLTRSFQLADEGKQKPLVSRARFVKLPQITDQPIAAAGGRISLTKQHHGFGGRVRRSDKFAGTRDRIGGSPRGNQCLDQSRLRRGVLRQAVGGQRVRIDRAFPIADL